MIVTDVPRNLRLAGVKPHKLRMVESDVFNICDRIKEVDPSLYVVLHDGHDKPWVVMEDCRDGEQRMVSRYARLDASILEDLRRMLAIPFQKRFDEVTRMIDEANKVKIEGEWFDKFAWEFQRALVDANMVDPVWHRSYRPVKKVARAH